MICAEESAPTDRNRLVDRPGPVGEPARYRTVTGAARVVRDRAGNGCAASSAEMMRGFACLVPEIGVSRRW